MAVVYGPMAPMEANYLTMSMRLPFATTDPSGRLTVDGIYPSRLDVKNANLALSRAIKQLRERPFETIRQWVIQYGGTVAAKIEAWVRSKMNGNGTTTDMPANGAVCIWPAKKDPVTGKCYLGTEVGPDRPAGDFGEAVTGAFGMPAIRPVQEQQVHLSCPAGMVLGKDSLCYPKQVLRRDSKFRKWRPGARPILTGGERRGIARAKRSINKARGAIGLASLK